MDLASRLLKDDRLPSRLGLVKILLSVLVHTIPAVSLLIIIRFTEKLRV